MTAIRFDRGNVAPVSNGPFRLLVISAAYPPIRAPESAHTLYLCQHLAARGLEIHLVTTQTDTDSKSRQQGGVFVHPIMKDWRWRRLAKLFQVVGTIAPQAVLLVYIDWIYQRQPMITFAPTLLRRVLAARTPFVTQFENESGLSGAPPPSLFVKLFRAVTARFRVGADTDAIYGTLLRDSDRIVVLSEHHLRAFQRVEPGVQGKSALIPAPPIMRIVPGEDGVPRRRGRKELGLPDDAMVFAYFGFVYPSKGLETLLKAFGAIAGNEAGPHLVIIGDSLHAAYLEELHQIAQETGAASRIRWTGHCDPETEEASLYLHAADVCVLPFDGGVRLNNSSVAVAAAHGLPIITTTGNTLEAAFVDRGNVYICSPRDPSALAAAMDEVRTRPDLRARLMEGARELARDWFSWERAIDATLETLGIAPGSLPVTSIGRKS